MISAKPNAVQMRPQLRQRRPLLHRLPLRRPRRPLRQAAGGSPSFTGNATFPNGVSQKYSSESAGKARMHTCLDQYNANKTSNGNGGLKWIQKGGGYYSECNKRLKG